MTQPPPPPPNQPPGGFGPPQDPQPGGFGAPQGPAQGGFGAPQQPGQGGFGAPTPPPEQPQGQPGYGYPQAPPQQPGYGYPAQPQQPVPPPYGYPNQPQQPQQPYGYPTAPQQAAQVPVPGGRKKPSAQAQIIIAAAVAVALIVGGGIWYANSGSDAPPEAKPPATGQNPNGGGGTGGSGLGGNGKEKPGAGTRAKLAFSLDMPKVPDSTPVDGSWLTDKAFVKTGVNSISGYDLDKGTPLWTLPLAGQVCGASRHVTADNKVPILFEEAKRVAPRYYQSCTQVGMVDLNTGKLLWSTSVSGGNAGDGKVRFSEITLSGQTVAAGGTDGGAAFDAADGKVRWKPRSNDQNCYDMGYGGGQGLVAVRKCGSYGSESVLIQNLDPKSGQPLSEFKMPTGVKYAAVVSTKPLVVAADVNEAAGDGSGISDFFSIDEKTGKLRTKIAADADRYAGRCASTKVEACSQVLVGDDRLYVPTEEHEGSTGEYGDETNEIIAFDLANGRTAAEKADAGDRYTLVPLRMDGGDIIAYKMPPYDKGGQVVSINAGTMKETLLLENQSDKASRQMETGFSVTGAEFRYGDGRLFISAVYANKAREGASASDKRYLSVSFSTKG